MRKKAKKSKLNSVLTALLVVFSCLLFFSIGVISGKGWSDREYKVRHIENDSDKQAAMADNEPLGDEMTQKEVELLTKRALEEAQAEAPDIAKEDANNNPDSEAKSSLDKMVQEMENKEAAPAQQDPEPSKEASMEPQEEPRASVSTAKVQKKLPAKRKVSSLPPKPSTPKPTAIDYTVQVAAYKTIEEAERHSEKLIDKGFPAFPVKAMIKGKPWYRVSIGSFKTRKQAMKYEKELKKQAVVKSTFVQKIKRLEK